MNIGVILMEEGAKWAKFNANGPSSMNVGVVLEEEGANGPDSKNCGVVLIEVGESRRVGVE